MFYRTKTNIVY